MLLTAWVTLAGLTVYFWTGIVAGQARAKYGVAAPSMDGPDAFLRRQRVQMNTLEQLPLFLPPLWMCGHFVGDRWAAAGGLLWCVGRILYALSYYKDPASRSAGYGISLTACGLLMGATTVALLMH
jgi:glutathione S-transferase